MSTINLKFPLRKSSQGAFATNSDTVEAIADDLRLLLLTNHGERVIHGDFGANLRKVIFDLQGTELRQTVRDSISSSVEKWMPFVILNKIDVRDSTTDNTLKENQIHVKINFSVGPGIEGSLEQRIVA